MSPAKKKKKSVGAKSVPIAKAAPPTPSPRKATTPSAPAETPAFQFLASARAAISGLDTFTPATLSRRGSTFVTDKYFSMILQKVEQSAELKQSTGINPAKFRTDLAFVNSLSSFPAACLALANDVAIYLDTMLLGMSEDARAATSWLAWKAKKSNDTNAAKTVAQLRAMPKGRGVTIPKKKKPKRAATETAASPAPAATPPAKKPPAQPAAAPTEATPEGATSVPAATA
jgi:hypothetical protein